MKKFRFSLVFSVILLIILLTIPTIISAESQEQISITYSGSTMWQGMNCMAKSGDFVYCGMAYGMLVLDVSDPTSPEFVSQVYAPHGHTYDIILADNTAYLDYDYGLYKVDISDPYNPKILSIFKAFDKNILLMKKSGNYIFATHSDAVRVYDISDFENVVQVAEYPLQNTNQLNLHNNYLFVGTEDDGLFVFDISNPENLQLAALQSDLVNLKGIDIKDNNLFITDGYGFKIYSFANFPSFEYIGEAETSYAVRRISIEGNYVITGGSSYHGIFDISDIEFPVLLSSYFPDGGYVNDIEPDGELLYLSCGNRTGLQIVDFSNPSTPTRIGLYDIDALGWTDGVAAKGNYVYVASEFGGFHVIDHTTTPNPSIVATINDSYEWRLNVTIEGDFAYVSARLDNSYGIKIVNISDPLNPDLNSFLEMGIMPKEICVSGNYAYCGVGPNNGLFIVDISNPYNPNIVGICDTPGSGDNIALLNNHIIICDGIGIQIINVSDPHSPYLVGFLETPRAPMAIATDDKYVYIGMHFTGIWVIDIDDPANPTVISDYFLHEIVRDMIINDDYLYFSNGNGGDNNGVNVFSLNDPSNLIHLANFDTYGFCEEIAVLGNKIFVDDEFALLVLETSAPFTCGNLNDDEQVNILDIVYLINYKYKEGPPPTIMASADIDGSGAINIIDIVYLINYKYKGGPEPICSLP